MALLAPPQGFGQSITVTNSPKAVLAWVDPNPAGTVGSYEAVMVAPGGMTLTNGVATNGIALSAFTNVFRNGSYTFSVRAVGTNGLRGDLSTNLTTLLLVPPAAVVTLQINFIP